MACCCRAPGQSRPPESPLGQLHFGLPKLAGVLAAATFLGLPLLLPIAASLGSGQGGRGIPSQSGLSQGLAVFSAFYRTGALVFGGGHVVLPLLENAVVARGWVDQSSFLSGYGAAQALPGPLFTFAAYLGAAIQPALHPVALSARVAGGDFSSGTSHYRRRPALLEQFAPAATDSGRPARGECRRGRSSDQLHSSGRCAAVRFTRSSIWRWLWLRWPCWCAGKLLRGSSSSPWHRCRPSDRFSRNAGFETDGGGQTFGARCVPYCALVLIRFMGYDSQDHHSSRASTVVARRGFARMASIETRCSARPQPQTAERDLF